MVRKKPTWVSWDLLPAVLRLCGEMRTPADLYQAGLLSGNARRVAEALEAAPDGVLTTGELRKQANFPTGKTQRAAYLKAVEELDSRLLVAKVFSSEEGDTEMRHALVSRRSGDYLAAARNLSPEAALDQLLQAYLPHAVYAVPGLLAKHLRLSSEAFVRAGLERLKAVGWVEPVELAEFKTTGYTWREA